MIFQIIIEMIFVKFGMLCEVHAGPTCGNKTPILKTPKKDWVWDLRKDSRIGASKLGCLLHRHTCTHRTWMPKTTRRAASQSR